jgi:hypothetical protein
VILRGNARDDIFFDDEDRYRFISSCKRGLRGSGTVSMRSA